jgi:ArsR family transcriptional regulator
MPKLELDDAAVVKVLKALAHPKRFQMVQSIASAGELSCGQIGDRFSFAQPTISHHLKILADAGVLVARRSAQHCYLSVNRELVDVASRVLPARLGSRAGGAAKRVPKGRVEVRKSVRASGRA